MVPSSPRQMGGSAGASGSPWAVDMVGVVALLGGEIGAT